MLCHPAVNLHIDRVRSLVDDLGDRLRSPVRLRASPDARVRPAAGEVIPSPPQDGDVPVPRRATLRPAGRGDQRPAPADGTVRPARARKLTCHPVPAPRAG